MRIGSQLQSASAHRSWLLDAVHRAAPLATPTLLAACARKVSAARGQDSLAGWGEDKPDDWRGTYGKYGPRPDA